jgi:hypothetical protein
MRRIVIATVLVVACTSAYGGEEQCVAGSTLDKKNGFRDAKFGASLSIFAYMRETEQEQYRTKTVKAYERESDDLRVFGQRVSHIIYYFFKQKLFLVRLEWSDDEAGSAVMDGFGRALGCESRHARSGPATTVFIRTRGKSVSFEARHSRVANAFIGWLVIERNGSEEAIAAQLRREASAQF